MGGELVGFCKCFGGYRFVVYVVGCVVVEESWCVKKEYLCPSI